MSAEAAALGVSAISNLIGSSTSANANAENNRQNIALQKEFAHNGIRWKVEDAKRAGIHPLFALGAQTHSFAPVNAGDTSIGPGLANMGQDLSRAIHSTRTQSERESAMADLQLENQKLQNEYLLAQIAKLSGDQTGPPSPTLGNAGLMLDGQVNSRGTSKFVVDKPLERTVSQPGRPEKEAGAVSDYTHVRTPFGYSVVPSTDVKQRIEDTFIPETMWSVRNQLLPNFMPKKFAPSARPPKGYDSWKWSYSLQGYIPWKSAWKSPSEMTRDRLERGLKRYVR